MRRNRILRVVIAGISLLLLTGCGAEREAEEQPQKAVEEWKEKGFAVSGDVVEEQELWTLEYTKWNHEELVDKVPAYNWTAASEVGAYDGQIYRIYDDYDMTTDGWSRRNYILERYNASDGNTDITVLDKEMYGDGYIAGMSVPKAGSYVFRIQKNERTEEGDYELVRDVMVFTDLQGEMEQMDLLEACRRNGITDQQYGAEAICDASGNCYIRTGRGEFPTRNLYIFDKDGNLLVEQKGDEYTQILNPLRTEQGDLIFPVYNIKDKNTRFLWFDLGIKAARTLAVFEKDNLYQIYGMQGNDIYYGTDSGIVKWDTVGGGRKLIYRFAENGVDNFYGTMLVLCDGQLPSLRIYGGVEDEAEDWFIIMSGTPVEQSEGIRITSLNKDSLRVKNTVGLATRRNPGLYFSYEAPSGGETRDEFRTRMIAEMVAGGGPDILYVSLDDMEILQNKGLLKELDEFISEDWKEQIYSGIIQTGTVNGQFVGLAPEMEVSTAITLKEIWSQDTTWTVEDILALMDTGDFTGVFCQGSATFAPRAVLMLLTMWGLEGSRLIDWETGESLFDSDLFLRMLETAKTYGDYPIRTDSWLGEGGCLGRLLSMDYEDFCELFETYGEQLVFVGEPTDNACGNYLDTDGVLVVNKNVSDAKAVSAFFETLLSDKIQENSSLTSKRSVRKNFGENFDDPEYKEAYEQFLESCVPRPKSHEDIESIVWEDASSYIEGNKSAEEVAKIVDNRVQLYLDELK